MGQNRREPPTIYEPGQALNYLLIALAFTAWLLWLGSRPGWDLVLFAVPFAAIKSLLCLRDLFVAHRHWSERQRRIQNASSPSGTFNKGGGEGASPEAERPRKRFLKRKRPASQEAAGEHRDSW